MEVPPDDNRVGSESESVVVLGLRKIEAVPRLVVRVGRSRSQNRVVRFDEGNRRGVRRRTEEAGKEERRESEGAEQKQKECGEGSARRGVFRLERLVEAAVGDGRTID
jgi:hypothetical protein